MTYCVAAKLSTGLVLLSDSRTNAGVDDISITKKMSIYKKKNDRTIFILCAGNLAITQSVKSLLIDSKGERFWEATSLYNVAEVVGNCIREVKKHERGPRDTAPSLAMPSCRAGYAWTRLILNAPYGGHEKKPRWGIGSSR